MKQAKSPTTKVTHPKQPSTPTVEPTIKHPTPKSPHQPKLTPHQTITSLAPTTIPRSYLSTLISVIGTPDIKVITGVRRSGKSTLLRAFAAHLQANFPNANIINIDFNSIDFDDIRTYRALNTYVEDHYDPTAHNFLLIDEVQMCENFETTINSLHNSLKYDIYLTGSNAFLQASDLATLFVGRVFDINIFPFSFQEYLIYLSTTNNIHPATAGPSTPTTLNQIDPSTPAGTPAQTAHNAPITPADPYAALDQYLDWGGFAGSYLYPDQTKRYQYISDIYDTLIIRDIQQKYHIQNTALLQKISDFLMNNISNLTTGRSITNTLRSSGHQVSHSTVNLYLNYLCDAFAFYKIRRFDVKGKSYLSSQDKYYLCDHTLKYAKLGTHNFDLGHAYENIVAIELLRRGYEVYVGTLGKREIDFVARRPNEKFYIQVSANISQSATFEREVAPLLATPDAYPKLLLTRTHQPPLNHEGIQIIDIADWLLSE